MLETHFSYTLEVIQVSVPYGSSVWSKLLILVNGGDTTMGLVEHYEGSDMERGWG